ncbi:MAG: hypothetical protein KDC48_21735 [Planctomycetes bacterium]|nr:hypothetical protein [Planctomycetota bacterium]
MTGATDIAAENSHVAGWSDASGVLLPPLPGGRRVRLGVEPLLARVRDGDPHLLVATRLAYRLTVTSADDLLALVTVTRPGAALPGNDTVRDVLAGRAGWGGVELAAFRRHLAAPHLQHWLAARFREFDDVVRAGGTVAAPAGTATAPG